MADRTFIGAAPAIAQVDSLAVAGTIEVGDLFRMSIGTKTFEVVAESTVAADVAQQIAEEWQALDAGSWPEYAEISAQANSADVVLEALTPGKPFTLTATTVESGGGASDGQTFVRSAVTDNNSPNSVGITDNWSGDALPVNGDRVIFPAGCPAVLWDLDALAAVVLGAGGVIVQTGAQLGLHETDDAGYPQYRTKFFGIQSPAWHIEGDSGLVMIDVGTATATALLVKRTGSRLISTRAALCIMGGNAGHSANILRGDVAFAQRLGETASFPTLRTGYVNNVDGDAQVYCGPDCALAAIIQNGGRVETWAAVGTSFVMRAGTHVHMAGGIAAPNVQGGTLIYNAIAAMGGAPKASGPGFIDFSQDPRDKLVTNPIEVYGNQARVSDPNNVVNANGGGSFILDMNETASIANIVIGPNRRITFGATA